MSLEKNNLWWIPSPFICNLISFVEDQLRRNLLAFPVPALPPPLHAHVIDHINQFLRRKFWCEKLLFRRTSPKLLAQARLYRTWMQTQAHCLLPTPLSQIDIHTLRKAINCGLARSVRVPTAERIIGDGAHAGRHERKDRGGWEIVKRFNLHRFLGKERGEMFCE